MAAWILWFGLVAYAAEPADPVCPAVLTAPGDAPVDRVQRLVVEHIAKGDAEGLYALWDEGMRGAVPLDATTELIGGLIDARGCLVASKRTAGGDLEGTYRIVAERGAWQMRVTADAAGAKVVSLWFGDPPAAEPPVANATGFGLPFTGPWFVVWGGATREQNYHVDFPSQRRAADLVKIDAEGRSCTGDTVESCYAYGEDVVAVGDGVVAVVIDGVPDSVLGVLNPFSAVGNAVVIEHSAGVYSVYAHLQPGSIRVKVGKSVTRGQVIGLVGNSGNSSEPHLHFQMQDGPRLESSWGLEMVFDEVLISREGLTVPIGTYKFKKGDVVSPYTPP